ncbi:hypothetical protein GGS26DRAFT_536271 [Hypomontagnella submonticulosa]|nr:hypothetical protein GGS26DRAFT_536271 [Hypomontagnella submonticulosa]
MAGRRRRAPSNSTVATVDENAIQYCTEESVLKPVSARVHTDDWPCFLLIDATIYHKDGTLANLLHVDLEGPLIVRGKLEIEKDQEKFLVNRNIRGHSPWIQIQNTLSFSIGLKEDGLPMPVLWASGGAGWYEIVPSDTYKNICDIMFQGISLHYAILDQYEAALEKLHEKKKNRNKTLADVKLSLDDVLFKYAVTVGDGITLPEAHKRTRDQAIFLLSHFPKYTQFYDWLSKEFPDTARALTAKESNDSKTAAISEPSVLVAVPYSPLEKSVSVEASDSRRRGRPSLQNSASRSLRNSETAAPEVVEPPVHEQSLDVKSAKTKGKAPMKLRSESTHDSDIMIIDVPDRPHGSGMFNNPEKGRNSLQASDKIDTPYSEFRESRGLGTRAHLEAGSSVYVVLEALQDVRQDLLIALKEGREKKHPDEISPKGWCNKLWLQLSIKHARALTEVCEYYAQGLVELLGQEWHNSQFYQWLKDSVGTEPKFEFLTEDEMKSIVRRKKNKDRAQASIASREPGAIGGKQTPRRGRPSGKVAGLRPSTGSKKRYREEPDFEGDEMDLDEDGVLRKTSKRSRYFTDDEQDKATDNDSSLVSDEDEDDDQDNDSPLTRVAIRAERLPSTRPNGPNQTWVCEEPDCDYVVRAADQEEGQALISEHFEAHEREAQEEAEQSALSRTTLMDLAVQESEKGHLPINHLLEKIRNLGDKAQRREEVQLNGQVVPQPIKRSLLI